MSALTLFTSWVRANCGPAKARKDLIDHARHADRQRRDCHFVIGNGLTRKRHTCLVHLLGHELFVFTLNEEQAAISQVAGAHLAVSFDRPRLLRVDDLPHSLENLDIESAGALDLARPIHARCTIDSGDAHFVAPLCLRLDMALSKATCRDDSDWFCRYFYPSPALLPSGPMALEFCATSDPRNPQEYAKPQIAAAFLRVFPDPKFGLPPIPFSNAAAQLVTFR